MKKLLEFILTNIADGKKFEIEETEEENKILLSINADPSLIGIIIGKGGKTIRNIRKIVSIKATLEQKLVNIAVNESN
jgi:predicted RNA-binding protein YlqC (UPF0109 family)